MKANGAARTNVFEAPSNCPCLHITVTFNVRLKPVAGYSLSLDVIKLNFEGIIISHWLTPWWQHLIVNLQPKGFL